MVLDMIILMLRAARIKVLFFLIQQWRRELTITVGIAVSSTPVAVNHATADVGIFLMIGALRQAYVPLAALRAG
jgi:hypothetical protein